MSRTNGLIGFGLFVQVNDSRNAGLLECFMVAFDLGPSMVEIDPDLSGLVREGCITGDKVEDTHRTVFVCEELLDKEQRKLDSWQVDGSRGGVLELQRLNWHVPSSAFISTGKRNGAVSLQWHDKMPLEGGLDEGHVLRRGVPNIGDNISKLQAVTDTAPKERAKQLVLRHLADAFLLARRWVVNHLWFCNDRIGDWKCHCVAVV